VVGADEQKVGGLHGCNQFGQVAVELF